MNDFNAYEAANRAFKVTALIEVIDGYADRIGVTDDSELAGSLENLDGAQWATIAQEAGILPVSPKTIAQTIATVALRTRRT